MTPSELKYHVESAGHEPYFFTPNTMRFFGDTMANYGCRDAFNCWELWRKRPVKYGLQSSVYFDKVTFECISNDER